MKKRNNIPTAIDQSALQALTLQGSTRPKEELIVQALYELDERLLDFEQQQVMEDVVRHEDPSYRGMMKRFLRWLGVHVHEYSYWRLTKHGKAGSRHYQERYCLICGRAQERFF